MEKMIRFIGSFVSIILLFFLTKNIANFFDIGIEIYGIYLMIAAVTLTFYGVLPAAITDVFSIS